MQQYIVHKWKLVNWVYIYRQQTAKICVKDGFCYITRLRSCNITSQTWIYHLPERQHVVLRCWKDKAWTSSTHILYGNGVIYSKSQCLLTTDKFQTLQDIIGNTQATIDPTKLYVHRPSCHRRESRNASTRGGDTSRDCPAGRPQIPSRDTSPNHRHGFTSQHEQNYNPMWTTIILAPCHTYSPLW